jgi:hypothetical protein
MMVGIKRSLDIYRQFGQVVVGGGCGDVSFAKLQHGKTEVTMHHYYSKVGVELMQKDGALEKKERLKKTQVRSVARSLLPLTSVGPHWILQDMHRKCYHFTNADVWKMYDKKFLSWCTKNPGQFQLTPCGAPNPNTKAVEGNTKAVEGNRQPKETKAFNYQQGTRSLCVPLCIASALDHGKDSYGSREFIKCCSTFTDVARPVLKAIDILRSKLKYKITVVKNVPFEAINVSSPFLSLIVLRGTDDYKGHAVCLMGGLIFDASNKTGVTFDRKNLDLCCGDGVSVKFHSAFRLYTCCRTH